MGNIGQPGRVTTPGTPAAAPAPAAAPTKAAPKKAAKKDPAVQARQQELIKAGAKIKADGIMGPQTQAAEKQFGAQIDAQKATAQQQSGGPTTVTNPAQANQAAATPAPSAEPAPAAEPAPVATTPPPQANALGVQAQAGGAFGQPAPQQDNPNPPNGAAAAMASQSAPAAEPAPAAAPANTVAPTNVGGYAQSATAADGQPTAPVPGVSTDTGLSTEPGKVKTGTGGTTNITTASQDEYAWRAKQGPMANMSAYPGPGKWDPSTGRTKRESIEYHEKDNALLQQMLRIAGLR